MEADQGTISEVKFSSAIGNTVSKNKTASIPEAERWKKQRRRGEAEKEEVKRKWERGGEAEESEMEEAEEERK